MKISRPLTGLLSMTAITCALAPMLTTACHDRPAEPLAVHDAGGSATQAPQATPHDVHHIVAEDHRRVIKLGVDEKIVLPNDPAFDWRVDFEDKGSFEPFARRRRPGGHPDVPRGEGGALPDDGLRRPEVPRPRRGMWDLEAPLGHHSRRSLAGC